MKYCPNCGGELTSGLKYCPSCGCMLPASAQEPLPEKEIFPENGTKRNEDNVFENIKSGKSGFEGKSDSPEDESAAGNAASSSAESSYDSGYGSGSSYSRSSAENSYSAYATAEPAVETRTNGFAIASLVCGIIALFLDFFFLIPSILAIVFGVIGIKNSAECNSGRGISIAGIIMGIISIALYIVLFLLLFVFAGVLVSI